MAVVVLAALVYLVLRFSGSGFLRDPLPGLMRSLNAAGEWLRTVLAIAFQSIPVR